jgi:hypothetical protein
LAAKLSYRLPVLILFWRNSSYQNELKQIFNWVPENNFTYQEIKMIDEVAWDMRLFYSNETGGKGKKWMDENIGNVLFTKGDMVQQSISLINGKPTSVTLFTKTIHLAENLPISLSSKRHIAHEVDHVADNKMGGGLATFFGGGPADELIKFMGGTPSGLRWWNGNIDVPENAQFKGEYSYANNSDADYFAEALAFLIYPNVKNGIQEDFPKPEVKLWFETLIDLTK